MIFPEIEALYSKVPCPMKRKDNCVTKIEKLFDKWRNLAKFGDNPSSKLLEFQNELSQLCDLSTKDAIDVISKDRSRDARQQKQDADFMLDQRTTRIGTLSPTVDKSFSERQQRIEKRKMRSSSSSTSVADSSKDKSVLKVESDDESPPAPESKHDSDYKAPIPRREKRNPGPLSNPNVLGSLERAGISSRKSTMALGAAAQACGEDLSRITLSKSTVHRKRSQFRVKIGKIFCK